MPPQGVCMKNKLGWHKFIANCHAIADIDQLNKFFELTLTPAEREKIVSRYYILGELIQGKRTQREIAAHLGVSIFNVTRGANQLKQVDATSKALIDYQSE
jgi:Trp operon repressor